MLRETHCVEPKNVGLYTWRGGGRRSVKVYCLYTHENVDIFGWPLSSRLNFANVTTALRALNINYLE